MDRRPESRMRFRLYEDQDEPAVRAIFEKQGLDVHLPIPGQDRAISLALVGEEDGVVKMALLLRETHELHLVASPDEPSLPYKVRRMGHLAEGMILEQGRERAKLKMAVPNDVIAFVPKGLPRMVDLMREYLGFIDEPDVAHLMVKRVGS